MKLIKGNNSKIRSAECRFLYTSLILNRIYHPMKFKDHSFYVLGEMAWTRIKYEHYKRALTQKIRIAE
jgi:hypothetical protein